MSTLATCRLSEEGLEQFARATRRMLAALRDPRVRAELQQRDAEPGDGTTAAADGVRSVAGIARQFERVPALRDALGEEGMSAREYVVVQLTLFQSTVAAEYLDAEGPGRMTELPRGTAPENVEFVRSHRPQIARLTAELRQLSAQPPAAPRADTADSRSSV